ncbi:hypothetical protein ACU4GR_10775 [Methylobacterium oryzae CBMB20]
MMLIIARVPAALSKAGSLEPFVFTAPSHLSLYPDETEIGCSRDLCRSNHINSVVRPSVGLDASMIDSQLKLKNPDTLVRQLCQDVVPFLIGR